MKGGIRGLIRRTWEDEQLLWQLLLAGEGVEGRPAGAVAAIGGAGSRRVAGPRQQGSPERSCPATPHPALEASLPWQLPIVPMSGNP